MRTIRLACCATFSACVISMIVRPSAWSSWSRAKTSSPLRLSRALLEAGRPHRFLPLSGVSHMTPQAAVTANLLIDQLVFLQAHLGAD